MSEPNLADDDALRQAALANLAKKRDFYGHLITYVVINTMLVGVWYMTGHGFFFWPVFPIAVWGIGVLFHARDVYAPRASEVRVRAEMNRLRRTSGTG